MSLALFRNSRDATAAGVESQGKVRDTTDHCRLWLLPRLGCSQGGSEPGAP